MSLPLPLCRIRTNEREDPAIVLSGKGKESKGNQLIDLSALVIKFHSQCFVSKRGSGRGEGEGEGRGGRGVTGDSTKSPEDQEREEREEEEEDEQ
jgi:hypothetical protein